MQAQRLHHVMSIVLASMLILFNTTIMFADIRDAGLAPTIYSDPKGWFKIRPPGGWLINEYHSDPRGKVDFNSSNASPKAQLKIIGQTSPFAGFGDLFSDCKNGAERMRSRWGGTATVKEITKFNVKAAEIRFDVPGNFKQLQIQVLFGKNYYTFAFGGRPDQYDKYLEVALKSIDSFEPVFKEYSSNDAKTHIIASKIRTAELYLSIGRKDWASVVIDEGLNLDEKNRNLLDLRERCKK